MDIVYREPLIDYEFCKRDIIFFLLLRALRYTMIKKKNEKITDLNASVEDFYNIQSNKWEEGKNYLIGKLIYKFSEIKFYYFKDQRITIKCLIPPSQTR